MASPEHVGALFTDLYEVTMAQAYRAEEMWGTAIFETFFRKLPRGRSYALAAGLADMLDVLDRVGEPLLVQVMQGGRRLLSEPDLSVEAARRRARQQIEALPPRLRSFDEPGWRYPVDISQGIASELERLRHAQR
jgi:hypothetical protein